MKYILLFAIMILCLSLPAQNIRIGLPIPAVASAKLDIYSTGKGILIPRMDSNARKAIAAPATGLMVYDVSTNACWYFDGIRWTIVEKKHWVGEQYGGGIVFYLDASREHGLIAAADEATSMRWWGSAYTSTMAFANGPGAGKANTTLIIASQGYGDGGLYAARVCNEYSVTVNNVAYSDWYLPSKFELNLMYLQKTVIGGFASSFYWSATESNVISAAGRTFLMVPRPTTLRIIYFMYGLSGPFNCLYYSESV